VNAQALPVSVIGELQVSWKFPQAQAVSAPGTEFSQLLASVTELQAPPEVAAPVAEAPQPCSADQKDAMQELLAVAPGPASLSDAPAVSSGPAPAFVKSKRMAFAPFVFLGSRKFALSTSKKPEERAVQTVAAKSVSPVVASRIVPVIEQGIGGEPESPTPADALLPETPHHPDVTNILQSAPPPVGPPPLQDAAPSVPSPEPAAPQQVLSKSIPANPQTEEQAVLNAAPAVPSPEPTAPQQVLSKSVPVNPTEEKQPVQSSAPAASPNAWQPAFTVPGPSPEPAAPANSSNVVPSTSMPAHPAPNARQPLHDESNITPKQMPSLVDEHQAISASEAAPVLAPEPLSRNGNAPQDEDREPQQLGPAPSVIPLGTKAASRSASIRINPAKPTFASAPLPMVEASGPRFTPPQQSPMPDAEQISHSQQAMPAVSMPVQPPPVVDLPPMSKSTAAVETMPVAPREPRTVDHRYSPPHAGFFEQHAAAENRASVQTVFSARLVPIEDATVPQPPDAAAPITVDPKGTVMQPVDPETAQVPPGKAALPQTDEKSKDTERPHRPDKSPDQPEAFATMPGVRTATPGPAAAPVENSASSRLAEPRTAEPHAPAKPQEMAQPHEVTETSTPVRDIKLQFTADEGRIQVRMAEHDGEVRVTVHASDQNVAGALREDLPSLSGRLEQAGFHAETWHGSGAVSTEPTHRAESPAGTPQQDTPDPGRQNPGRQQQEQQQERRAAEEKQATTKRSDDFSWLFESLR
jgi:hypothetical protein